MEELEEEEEEEEEDRRCALEVEGSGVTSVVVPCNIRCVFVCVVCVVCCVCVVCVVCCVCVLFVVCCVYSEG